MADETATPDTKDTPPQSDAAKKLNDFVRQRFRELAQDRISEDAEWFLSGCFNLGRQWMTKADKGKYRPMNASDFGQNWTLPVSDHFSKTIAVNANALGAQLPKITALSENYDGRSSRQAAYAEAVFDTANRESGVDKLNPILGLQNVLWGIAWTKDTIAFDLSTEDVPLIGQQTPFGEVSAPAKPAPVPEDSPAAPAPEEVSQTSGTPQAAPEAAEEDPELQVLGTERIPAPRLKTTLPSPFSVFIPRDASDANDSPEYYELVPFKLGEARQMFPQYKSKFSADGYSGDDGSYADSTSNSLALLYKAQLRRIGLSLTAASNSSQQGRSSASSALSRDGMGSGSLAAEIHAVEAHVDWAQLTEEIQEALEAEWGDQPSQVEDYAKKGMTKLSAAIAYGVFAICWGDLTLQFGENSLLGEVPYTAFQWEKNSLNPYGKGGLGSVLRPLQRQLNQLDALAFRQLMSTGTTKILMPESQQYKSPPGDPVDLWEYDDAVGKHAPQLIPAGNSGWIPQKREQIIEEFQSLGYTEGVGQGQAPGGVDAFRAIAYLGEKAEEQRGTQRFLFEQSHELRSKKLLVLAKRVWTTPRKIRVAGNNNRFGMELLEGADLDFESDQITIVQGSSRPKTLADKLQALQTLMAMPGFVDPSDPEFQQIVLDSIGMPEVKLMNSLQFSKADRDLQQVLDGMQPVSSPAQDWGIVVKRFSEYTLTEEYEGLPPETQAGILGYMAWAQELSAPPPIPGAMPPPGPGNPTPGQTLHKVPGKTATAGQAQQAAGAEGAQVANAVDGAAQPAYT